MIQGYSLEMLINQRALTGDPVVAGTLNFQQYTGLKDKNGLEIYEGDILSFAWGIGMEPLPLVIGQVSWEAPCYRVQNDDVDIVLGHDYEDKRLIFGNIYENPDLIP